MDLNARKSTAKSAVLKIFILLCAYIIILVINATYRNCTKYINILLYLLI